MLVILVKINIEPCSLCQFQDADVCACASTQGREKKEKVCVRVCASAFSSVLMKYTLLIFEKYYLCTSPGLNNKKKMRFELAKDKKKKNK